MQNSTQRLLIGDFHPNAGSAMPGEPSRHSDEQGRFEPYKRLHRLMRGRYHMMLPLVALAALLGAIHGWRSQVPVYRSEGLIYVADSLPAVMNSTDQNEPMQMFEEFVESQMLLMTSEHVISTAIQSPDFQKALNGRQDMTVEQFATDLTVEHPPRTQAIHLSFASPDPNIASQGVKGVITAFLENYGVSDGADEDRRLSILTTRKEGLTEQIASLKAEMANIKAPSATSIAMVDDLMRDLFKQQAALEAQSASYEAAGWGSNRPMVAAVRKRLAEIQTNIDDYREEVRRMQVATVCSAPQDRHVPLLAEFLPYAKQMENLLDQLDETDKRIDVLHTEDSLGAERFRIMSDGELPSTPYADKRARMAAFDGAGAACFPLGIFLLLGMMDRRFRFSDDAQHVGPAVPLLGVLPVLPSRRLYPELARIAAYCVHNLRIRLQLLAHQDKSSVFMITSAAAGEGKTSLSLALGLSFASSGKRVLLLDCDAIGRGLTHRLKRDREPGVAECIAGASLAIASVVSPNLTFLPAGNADESLGEIDLAAEPLRKLLDNARSRFDIVLIDTGPVLSSLQNPVIAQVADFVILTVSQGQQQPLVERSLRMLQSVGIRVSGFVFNRASSSDYRRWIGGPSYYDSVVQRARTSKFLAKGDAEAPLGPLAGSVASKHFASTNGNAK
jgi:succinoglycan biosynthesis transport protein ExoP